MKQAVYVHSELNGLGIWYQLGKVTKSHGDSAHNPLYLWCCQVRPLNKKTYTIFPVLIGYSLTHEDTLFSECCRMRDSSTICQIKFLSKKLEISPFQVQDQNVE